jgi:hypothetical protein
MANKQPVKKKDISTLSSTFEDKMKKLSEYKEINKLNGVKDKDLEWIVMPEAFYDALKIPGIPKGFFSMVRGLPDTGKSTIKLCYIAQLQRQGILPVIFETEGNFPWDHAKMCGVQFEDVYEEVLNEETGELENKVVDHKGFFLYYDQEILFRQYGKMDYAQGKELSKPNRKIAVLEDVAYAINDLLDKQGSNIDEGEIDFEMGFVWDSVGSLPSYRSVMSKTGNNMFDAGALKQSFNSIITNRIPMSRKESSLYTNTFLVINKVWIDSMQMGQPQMKNSGGEGFNYAVRLRIEVGGIQGAGVARLKATSGGADYYFGTQTKIKVTKNHVNDITYEGKICSLSHGLWNPDKIDEYKKQYTKYLLDKLSSVYKKDFGNASIEIQKEGDEDGTPNIPKKLSKEELED